MANRNPLMSLPNPVPQPAAELVPRPARIGRDLQTPAGWLREMGILYRLGLCQSAGRLAKDIEELRELQTANQTLRDLQARQVRPLLETELQP